ncbi:MAG: hypothetical protein FWD61_20585 [Phycisphaerales bacterium]|nr:hypothetical protein [Phycisphaerales bacterium]
MSHRRQLIRTCLISIVAVVFVFGLSYAGLRWLARSAFPDDTTDVSAYPSTLKEWSATGLVSHFPPHIPPHAKNIKFSARPKILQGGAHIQIRMQLSDDEIGVIEAQLKEAAIYAYDGNNHHMDSNMISPPPTFQTLNDPETAFASPARYKLYVLSAKDKGAWNHGETSGAAVSTTNHEVIYWAESW